MADNTKYNVSDTALPQENTVETLRQSEERFRLLVEAVKDYAIFLIDPEGYIISWNAGAERIKGYTADEIIGKHFSIFYPPDEVAKGWPMQELDIAHKEGRFEDEGWRIHKDGSRFWANVTITPLYDRHGSLWGFAKVTRDLTERYETTQAMQRAHEELDRKNRELQARNRELQARNRELQNFASVASHDLQEPLRKINTFSELLEQEYADQVDEAGRMYLDRIRSAATRMSTLINDLLSYTRVSMQTPSYRSVDLNAVVDEVVNDLETSISDAGGRVITKALPTIEADPTQMRQLFQNLIGNSIKFHRPGVPPEVYITGSMLAPNSDRQERSMCRITVEDNGIGFEEKYLDRIFAPFQRLHTRREYPGTGIGLAICKQIVERHGGSITARSTPGEGTTFTILLPLSHEHSDEDA